MFGKNMLKIVPGILVAMVLLSYVAYATVEVNAPSAGINLPDSAIEKLAAEPGMKRHQIELAKPDQAPKLNEQQAIARAKEIIGTAFNADKATSIKAVYTLFTDNETPKLPEKDVLLKNLPVWIITFDGLNIQRHGPRPKGEEPGTAMNTQMHVIIDANTGEELIMLSYK